MAIILKDFYLDVCKDTKAKIDMKGSLTLPKTILQVYLKGKRPSKELVDEALQSIDEIARKLKV